MKKSKPKVSKSLIKTMPFFKIVSKLPEKIRKSVLKELGGDRMAFNALHEIAYNTINKNYTLRKSQLKRLKPHAKLLEKFCCEKNKRCLKKRKNLIVQSGGFLPILIPAVATVLASIINKI